MGSRSEHHCWAKSKGCNKQKANCPDHYWTCTGEGTRTHKSCIVKKGGRCESNCTDTSDNKLYKCNIKSMCHPLNSPVIVLIYLFLVDSEWCCDNTNHYAAPLRQILFRSQSYLSYFHFTFLYLKFYIFFTSALTFLLPPYLAFLYPPSYFTILKFYLRPCCTISRSSRSHTSRADISLYLSDYLYHEICLTPVGGLGTFTGGRSLISKAETEVESLRLWAVFSITITWSQYLTIRCTKLNTHTNSCGKPVRFKLQSYDSYHKDGSFLIWFWCFQKRKRYCNFELELSSVSECDL